MIDYKELKQYHTDWRYFTSTIGGAMLGAAMAGVIGALIGSLVGMMIANLISRKE
jgi:uncharacterized protein YqgC (DUF456 family)